ncbi:MAG TPA: macro domain-containing protein [Gemmatimonadaceae bacterium]|nr:macro domain-containing protein [Gemmatimonadaceae bacterium]
MITVLRADITTLPVDAIVNAANAALRGGGGVDGAIHRAAGPQLMRELQQYGSCATGGAVLTGGYNLPARYVIHAVGPIWHGGSEDEAALLGRTYESAFARALEHHDIHRIAFSAISTGVYGFPKAQAAEIAVGVMRRHETRFDEIIACVFDSDTQAHYDRALRRAASA